MFHPCCVQFFPTGGSKIYLFTPQVAKRCTFILLAGHKVNFTASCSGNTSFYWPRSRTKWCVALEIVYYETRKKKVYFASVILMPKKSESNNHTSKINVSPVLHTIFFPLRVKNWFICPASGKKVHSYSTSGS